MMDDFITPHERMMIVNKRIDDFIVGLSSATFIVGLFVILFC